MSKNLSHLSGRKGLEDNLFDRLGQLTQERGTPEKADLEKLAKEFLMGAANTYGTATFYDFMRPENQGKKVYVCNGSVCLCAGTQDGLKERLTEHFAEEEIGEMCCLGRCHENNAFFYNGHNYSGEAANDIAGILESTNGYADNYQVAHLGTPVLTRPAADISTQGKLISRMLEMGRDRVLDEIKASGVRGRGGAGFPMGTKLGFAKAAESDTKFIICNADEGDPGAYSDRWLLEQRPHSVLLGMMAAGFAIGAEWGVVYIRAEYPESVGAIETAIQDLKDNNLLGRHILDSDFHFHFKVIHAQGSYICGEETALINSIEGQRPEVRVRPPFPAQEGLFRKPTIVNNVETLAVVPFILENGGSAYADMGTEKSNGTKLVCLDSRFIRPGMYEVEMGTPLRKVVDDLGGGFREPVKALHIGGPLGGMVPVSRIDDLTVDFESFCQ